MAEAQNNGRNPGRLRPDLCRIVDRCDCRRYKGHQRTPVFIYNPTGRSAASHAHAHAHAHGSDIHGNRVESAQNRQGLQGQQTAALQIQTDGNWSVTLKPLALLRVWDGIGTWTGKGDDLVVIPSGTFTGLDSLQITNSSQSNFVVTADGDTENLLVNEIGNYSGEQLMPAGTVLLEIQSDGTWSLHKV